MSTGPHSKPQHFDNLSYISDGRDRISYVNDPYAVPSYDGARHTNGVTLQPSELKKARRENNTIYTFRPGQEHIYAYNNAAFSDISGADSHGPSFRSQHSNLYASQKSFEKSTNNSKVHRICSKYWYVFVLIFLIILAIIGAVIGFVVFRSRTSKCYVPCDPSEKLVQLNSTHCECQFVNECEFEPPVCQLLLCFKFNGTGYECLCTPGFQHPPSHMDLTRCEDIDECKYAGVCGEHQICQNSIGNYTCSCETGYESQISTNGLICRDRNECLDGTRCSNAYCVNTNGSFKCVCYPGFQLDVFNPSHCENINECHSSHNCTGINEICEDTIGSFKCICAPGYRRDQHGNCLNINECTESNTTCDINSRCEDRNGSFACCMNMVTDRCIECGYDYTTTRAVGMSSSAFSDALIMTSPSFAITNATTPLNAIKKLRKNHKLKTVVNHVRRARMIDGQSVEAGHFPWIAIILIKEAYYHSEPRYVCSASLVSSWNIITAAHCLDEEHFRKQWDLTSEPSSFKDIFDIRIGVHNLSSNSTDFLHSQSHSIANFTLHSEYQSLGAVDATVKNDVALIRLTERIARSSTNDWVCLPTTVNVYDQEILKVVSYSHTDSYSIQEQLDIRALNNQESQRECQRQLSDIAEDAFCAISTSNSSVLGMGDSGAGAMLFSNNRSWQLAGIMSKTGLEKSYSAMTNLSMHIEWLQSLVER